jgi:uncharacterized protein with HEPN domain
MPRSALAYLIEMDEACQFLIERTASMTLEQYLGDRMLRLAVERCFITIGEAIKQLHRHHPAIDLAMADLPGIIAFRNVIVHEYWAVDSEDVWSKIVSKVPLLKAELESVLHSLDQPPTPKQN